MRAWQTLITIGLVLSFALVTDVRAEDLPEDPPAAEPAALADPDEDPPDDATDGAAEDATDDAELATNQILPAGRENPSMNPNDEKSVEDVEGLHYMVPTLKNQGTGLNEGKRQVVLAILHRIRYKPEAMEFAAAYNEAGDDYAGDNQGTS